MKEVVISMDDTIKVDAKHYKALLKRYIESQDETSLYHAEQVSKQFIKDNVLPDEIINLHNQALIEIFPDLSFDIQYSMNFLLETRSEEHTSELQSRAQLVCRLLLEKKNFDVE